MIKRVALVGSSSTGKTTVYELLKSSLTGYKFINESTRTVAKYGFPINEQGTDATQLAISSFHLEALLTESSTVYDRSYLDLATYTVYMDNVSNSTYNYILDIWGRVMDRYTHYIYFPIEFTAVDDGVRSIDENWRRRIDAHFKVSLDLLNVNYLTVSGSPKQRVEQILKFIEE